MMRLRISMFQALFIDWRRGADFLYWSSFVWGRYMARDLLFFMAPSMSGSCRAKPELPMYISTLSTHMSAEL